jgi:hypothetical protein
VTINRLTISLVTISRRTFAFKCPWLRFRLRGAPFSSLPLNPRLRKKSGAHSIRTVTRDVTICRPDKKDGMAAESVSLWAVTELRAASGRLYAKWDYFGTSSAPQYNEAPYIQHRYSGAAIAIRWLGDTGNRPKTGGQPSSASM